LVLLDVVPTAAIYGRLDQVRAISVWRCFDEETIRASCEDYRAGATIDLQHDRADHGRLTRCPVLVLWSKSGIGSTYDVLGIWREQAARVSGQALDCGHFLAEEQPAQVAAHIGAWLRA
jgi:haloacetate dehalogenase